MWRDRKWCQSHDRKWRQSRDRKWRHFPVLFSYQSSSTKCPVVVFHSIYGSWLFLWYLLVIVLFVFCTTTLVRKKRGENDVTSSYDVTSGHVTDVTSGHVTSDHVTSGDVISDSTPFPKLWWSTGPQTSRSTDQTPNMRLPQYSQRFCDENEFLFFEKVRENDTRKMTSRTRKTSNVAFQTLRFEKVL